MLKSAIFQQKQAGIILIILGALLAGFVLFFVYFKAIRVTGFAEILPVTETAFYLEFPVELADEFGKKFGAGWLQDFNWTQNTNGAQNIAAWAKNKAALVFLQDEDGLFPLILLKTQTAGQAFEFLKNYKNPAAQIEEIEAAGSSTKSFSTPILSFAFLHDMIAVSPSKRGLEILLAYQSPLAQHLSSDADFIKIYQNLTTENDNGVFAYLNPAMIPRETHAFIAQYVPSMPFMITNLPAFGISAAKNNKVWQGKSYVPTKNSMSLHPEQAYRALLIPFLPPDFNLMLAGQNLSAQLEKIAALAASEKTLPQLGTLIQLFSAKYLAGLDFKNDIAPLLQTEFALAINGDKILFITMLQNQLLEKNIEKLRDALAVSDINFEVREQNVVLPDETKASELVAVKIPAKKHEENFEGFIVEGLEIGGQKLKIFDAATQGKWFISNNLDMLKKALLLTKNPGVNLRDTDLYRKSLQPIMKNPELLGIAGLLEGTFSFSKRTFIDHMETQFMFIEK